MRKAVQSGREGWLCRGWLLAPCWPCRVLAVYLWALSAAPSFTWNTERRLAPALWVWVRIKSVAWHMAAVKYVWLSPCSIDYGALLDHPGRWLSVSLCFWPAVTGWVSIHSLFLSNSLLLSFLVTVFIVKVSVCAHIPSSCWSFLLLKPSSLLLSCHILQTVENLSVIGTNNWKYSFLQH